MTAKLWLTPNDVRTEAMTRHARLRDEVAAILEALDDTTNNADDVELQDAQGWIDRLTYRVTELFAVARATTEEIGRLEIANDVCALVQKAMMDKGIIATPGQPDAAECPDPSPTTPTE